MVANLNIVNGEASFAYAGERPWHDLGTKVPGLMTTREALVAGRLDWYVDKKEMVVKGDLQCDDAGNVTETQDIIVPNAYATVRRDTNQVLGIVGPGYEVVQNLEAFAPFEKLFGQGSAVVETVGALGLGERIFAMARCPEVAEIVPGDIVERFLLLTSSHDGTGAVKALFTPVRVVCQNTLTAALRGAKNTVSIKHTKNVKKTLDQIQKLLGASDAYWTASQNALKSLAAQNMDTGEVKAFLKDLFPGKKLLDATGSEIDDAAQRTLNMRENIERLFDGQATGADMAGKTKWGLFNAVTHFIDHERTGRERKDGREVSMWENSVLGLGADLRQRAMDLLLAP